MAEHVDTPRLAQRIAALGFAMPELRPPGGSYVPVRVTGELAFVAGQVSRAGGGSGHIGSIGDSLSVEDGHAAARMCALNLFAQLDAAGLLERVVGCISVRGYVNAVAAFDRHAAVIDGASDLIVAVLGESGRHARAAVGAGSLPGGFAVEVEAVFELRPTGACAKAGAGEEAP